MTTGDDIRVFLSKEFGTETPNVLETPQFSYGVVFVDDVHLIEPEVGSRESVRKDNVEKDSFAWDHESGSSICDGSGESSHFCSHALRMSGNRADGVLKGLLGSTPLFSCRRRATEVKKVDSRSHQKFLLRGRLMITEPLQSPVVHLATCTDPREEFSSSNCGSTCADLMDNYVMPSVGVISAYSGDPLSFMRLQGSSSSSVARLLPHMCAIGAAAMDTAQLHVSLIHSAYHGLTANMTANKTHCFNYNKSGSGGNYTYTSTLLDVLTPKILCLCRFTMNVWSRVASSVTDSTTTTWLEKQIRFAFLKPSIASVLQLSEGLYLGRFRAFNNSHELLHLWMHELQRFFIDPFPDLMAFRSSVCVR